MESRIVTPSEFMKEIKRAEKATGKKFKIPSGTQKLCLEAMKDGFHKIDYQGKVGKARIYEVDPNRQIACFISEGKRIQWNGSFWDNFLLKPDGLYI